MGVFHIGDLVEVKKNKKLSPTLRFFYNTKGMIIRVVSESHHNNKIFIREWEVLFATGKRASFKEYELVLIAKADPDKGKNE